MRYRKLSSLTALTTLIFTISQPPANFPRPFQESQVLAQTSPLGKAEVIRLSEQGIEQFQTRQFDAAFESWHKALSISQEIKDRKWEGNVLSNLGRAYYLQGEYAKAIDYLQQQLAIARELDDRQNEEKNLAYLGLASLYLSDYAQGIDYLQQQLAIARSLDDRQAEAGALGNLGIAYDSLGEYAKAIEYHQQHLAIAREIKNRQSEGKALGNLGLAYLSLDDYAKVIEYQKQWLAIAKDTDDRQSEGNALGNLGLAYLALDDHAKAIEYQQQWLAIAREIKDRQSEGNALSGLGVIYTVLGDYAKAIDHLKQSLAIKQATGDLSGEGASLNNLGAALFNSGNFLEAEKILSEGIEKREKLREKLGSNDAWKVSIFEEQAKTYLLLQKALIAQNKTEQALEASERGRARAFVELLARRLSPQSETPPPIKHPTPDDLKKLARQQNATLVEYSIVNFKNIEKPELFIWVVSPNGKVTFRSIHLNSLDTPLKDLVTTTRKSIGVRSIFEAIPTASTVDPKSQTKKLQQLHQLLIQPIADLLPSNPSDRVIFIPHQDLFLVPFPALIDPAGKYLIEKHTLLTAPSIQVLELTRLQRERINKQGLTPLQKPNAVIVGNPTMPSVATKIGEKPQPLKNLPGAKQEAEAIAPLFNASALTGDAATETEVKAKLPQAGIIHLATHGLFDDLQGLQSAIALAPSGKDNGLLTAEEILNLKLNADLVVLSACNTGRGRITGDGVIGLSRSFISAGIPSVIVSLWEVPDSTTTDLMSEFYTNFYQKKLDKAEALRLAMLQMMEKHRDNPRAWAAFTLIGEAE
jgi:CHAT domain-containing protein